MKPRCLEFEPGLHHRRGPIIYDVNHEIRRYLQPWYNQEQLMPANEVQIQRDYYQRTADRYDQYHITGEGEHDLALAYMVSMVQFLQIRSILDIGSGTGRALTSLQTQFPV
jgi:hypothetical protein